MGIIGGADGPTAIYVTHAGSMSYAVIAGVVLGAAAVVLLLGWLLLHRDGG